MKNAFTLLRVLTKNSEMKLPSNGTKGKLYMSLGTIALCCIMLPCCFIVGYISYVMTKALLLSNNPTISLLAIIQIMSAFSLVFGMLVIFNILFFSSDREHLIPLPFKAIEILTAKFLYAFFAESVMEFLVLASMFIGFSLAYGFSIITLITSIVGTILIPLLPLLICAIFSLIIMTVLKGVKNEKIFHHFSSIFLIAFIILFLLSFKNIGEITIDNYINTLSSGTNLFSNILNYIFFTVPFLIKALEEKNLIFLLIYIILNIAAFAFMLLIGKFTYQAGLYKIGALGEHKEKNNLNNKSFIKHSPFKAYISKEFKVLTRTKAYASNCFYINIIWPAGTILFLALNIKNLSFCKYQQYFQAGNEKSILITTMGIIILSFIAGALNSLASTAFTREGAHIDIIHYLPCSYDMQIKAKGFISIIITYPVIAISITIWCLFCKCPLYLLPLYLLISLLCIITTKGIGLYLDSLQPHTSWDDEYSALRGNLNNFFNMAVIMVLSVLISLFGFILFTLFKVSIWATLCIYLIITVLTTIFSITKLKKATLKNLDDLR